MRTLHFRATALLLALSVVLFLSGCGDDDDDGPTGPQGGSAQATVTPSEGGSVSFAGATLDIPPNAVNVNTTIFIAVPQDPPDHAQFAGSQKVGFTYEFGPPGTVFSVPVQITIDYNEADLMGENESLLTLMTYEDDQDTPMPLDNVVVDFNANQVRASVSQFSYYFLALRFPEPSGGNPAGSWTFDQAVYALADDPPAGTNWAVSAQGEGNLDLGISTWDIDQSVEVTYTRYLQIGGDWQPVDTIMVTHDDRSGGSYTVSGDTLRMTVAYSQSDPGTIGDLLTFPFTAELDRLILYDFELTETQDSVSVWWVYRR